jgi:hypothetical protein
LKAPQLCFSRPATLSQLAEVQRGLNELGSNLDLPPETELTYHPGRLEPRDADFESAAYWEQNT